MEEKFLIPGIVFILVLAIFYSLFNASINWSFAAGAIAFGIVLYFVWKMKK